MTSSPTPVVRVIIPVYNAAEHLASCLDAVAQQTLDSIEVICVNDGSTDGSADILNRFAALDARVRAIHQENQGAGAARNAGLAAAKGEYVIFLDADDLYEPTMLEQMVARARTSHADVVICLADALEENGTRRAMPNQLRRKLLRRCGELSFCPRLEIPQHLFQFVCGWAWDKLYRRDFVLRTKLQFQNLRHTNDAFFVYLSLVAAAVVSIEPAVLVHHRLHAGSISHNTHRDVTSLSTALLAIHTELLREHAGNAALLKSFHHWAMNMAVWHYRQLSGEAATAMQQELRQRLEPVLQLLSKGAVYYPRKRDWRNYKELIENDYKWQEICILGISVGIKECQGNNKIISIFGMRIPC